MADQASIDVGYMSLPADVQHEIEQAAASSAAWTHVYLSTSCLHALHTDDPVEADRLHGYCAGSVRLDGENKAPARCKTCAATCVCPVCQHVPAEPTEGEPVTSPAPVLDDLTLAAEAVAALRNGVASDGRGWFRSDDDRASCYAIAHAVVDALRAAGRLLPDGAETSVEWSFDCQGNICSVGRCHHGHQCAAEAHARACAKVAGGVVIRRLVGPWLPVPDTDKETPGD